ncbi:hypothetical protein JCM15519_01800 [Fundidesulfovibrio butyratiphilus]
MSSSSDDAAGLAVRALMRSDISSLNQGIRNANDAISLIQTADGALGVIDEKLIRMKELATQASTGTYTSDQRLIIDSEYQAMASEITRIANSTDFNGIHLLNGNLSGATHSGAGLVSTGKLKVHFGTGNLSAEDYYYIQIGTATASALGLSGTAVTKEPLLSKYGLTTSSSGALNSELWWSSVPASVQSQFDATQTAEIYSGSSSSRTYAFATDKNGNQKALWAYASTGVTVDTYGGMASLGAGSSSGSSIFTQELAQKALDTINKAIVSKDKIRTNLGALQNRLSNTVSNLQIQGENLQPPNRRFQTWTCPLR